MDIKELNKTQLILLTLLITFVVSIATGIVTVSLMQQMPKSVPQTINNVIQRTIEKVTVPAENTTDTTTTNTSSGSVIGETDAMVSLYSSDVKVPLGESIDGTEAPKPLGQGIIISDVGLLLVDSNILTDKDLYAVVLNKTLFDATVLKKFGNGFTILKITAHKDASTTPSAPVTPAPTTEVKP